MPIIEGIEGRLEEICYTPDGRQIYLKDFIFDGVKNIREAQVTQDDIHHFTLLVVPREGFGTSDIELLTHNMNILANGVTLEVKPVDMIYRTSAGKLRTVICKLPKEVKDFFRHRV